MTVARTMTVVLDWCDPDGGGAVDVGSAEEGSAELLALVDYALREARGLPDDAEWANVLVGVGGLEDIDVTNSEVTHVEM